MAAGGTIGTLARDLLLGALPQGNYAIPWTLICLNIIGAALLGVLASRFLDLHPHRHGPRLFLATGVLGGFTTYSSLVSAAVVDGHHNHLDIAFITLLATSIVGVVAAWLAGRTRRSELA